MILVTPQHISCNGIFVHGDCINYALQGTFLVLDISHYDTE